MADSSHASTVISDLPPPMDGRKEFIGRTASPETVEWFPGLRGHLFAGASRGAKNLTTFIGSLEIRAQTQFHRHPCSEVVTPLDGDVVALVDNRRYDLRPLETIHIPAGIGHAIFAPGNGKKVTIHVALADADPKTEFLPRRYGFSNRGLEPVRKGDPEYIARREIAESYSLGDGALFKDLFAGRFGTKGICGGYAEFNPGGSLPCHIHKYDESITIISGTAICEVAGTRYTMSNNDTALVPTGRPHRFLNQSAGKMAMVWVYAGDEPERTLQHPGYCVGVTHCDICKKNPRETGCAGNCA
jgi:hypothetical protein